jgi:DNA-binding transcriptional MerR regulator
MSILALTVAALLAAQTPPPPKSEAETLKAELEKKNAQIQELQRQLEVQLAQIQELTAKADEHRAKLAKSLNEKSLAVGELQHARQLSERLQQDLGQLEEKHAELERNKKNLEEMINAIAKAGGNLNVAPKKALEAKVTAVANETGLVVISIGKDDGVLEGDEFTVYRGGDFAAKVVIDRSDRKWSAGKVVLKKSDPRVGDNVSNHIYVSGPLAAVQVVPRVPLLPQPSTDELRSIRKELDEVRAQVRQLSDRIVPSWKGQGVSVEETPEELRAHLGLQRGLLVRQVREGSPAEKAGFKANDVVPDLLEAQLLEAIETGMPIQIVRRGQRLQLPGAKGK